MSYVILATVKTDGAKTVRIYGGDSLHYAKHVGESRLKSGRVRDYQTADCGDISDVKRCLMSNFGIGFFNVARTQIKEIERRLQVQQVPA